MNNKFEIDTKTVIEDIHLLQLDMNNMQIIEGKELDKKLINEANIDMKKLEDELSALLESIHLINEMVHQDGEKLEKVEEVTAQIDIQVTDATSTIETTVPLLKSIKNKYLELKMAGGGISGGLLFGGIGTLLGGPVGLAIGAPLGAGLGTLGGWLTKFI